MKFNRSSGKLCTLFILSLSSLSTFSGNASARELVPYNPSAPVMVQQPAVQPIVIQTAPAATNQDSVGDYLIKKQVAKDLKANRNTKVWGTRDTLLQVLFLGTPLATTVYHANNGTLKEFYAQTLGDGGLIYKYQKNPFEHDDRDKTTMKSVADWGLTKLDIAFLPKQTTLSGCLDKTVVCRRSELMFELNTTDPNKEPDERRIFAGNKKDPDTGETMNDYDKVVRSPYRFERIKDLQISEIQKKIIKGENIDLDNLIWDGIKICGPIVLGGSLSAGHFILKAIQKSVSAVGNVIDKQQNIAAIKATRS